MNKNFLIILDVLNILIKVFKVLCYTKILLDQLPTINPYIWPFSAIRILTESYFKLWLKILPNIRIGSGSYDISSIVAMEFLNKVQIMLFWVNSLILSQYI